MMDFIANLFGVSYTTVALAVMWSLVSVFGVGIVASLVYFINLLWEGHKDDRSSDTDC